MVTGEFRGKSNIGTNSNRRGAVRKDGKKITTQTGVRTCRSRFRSYNGARLPPRFISVRRRWPEVFETGVTGAGDPRPLRCLIGRLITESLNVEIRRNYIRHRRNNNNRPPVEFGFFGSTRSRLSTLVSITSSYSPRTSTCRTQKNRAPIRVLFTYEVCTKRVRPSFIFPRWPYSPSSGSWNPSR